MHEWLIGKIKRWKKKSRVAWVIISTNQKKGKKEKKRKGATKPWRTRISADNYRIVVVVRRVRRAKRERGHLKVNGGLPRWLCAPVVSRGRCRAVRLTGWGRSARHVTFWNVRMEATVPGSGWKTRVLFSSIWNKKNSRLFVISNLSAHV